MGQNVLIVENEPDIVKLIQKTVGLLGCNSMVARDGVEAVALAVANVPDLIIMDICLPKMDGLQAVSQIRKNPKTYSIPILAATAYTMPGDREKCLRAGCNDYLAKPFTHQKLGAAIKLLLK